MPRRGGFANIAWPPHNARVRILILGIGDAFTSRHFGSSALIRTDEGDVLIDCPALLNRALREASDASGWTIDIAGIDDIILTHLHGDHCNGLEAFGFQRRMMRRQDDRAGRPRLHTIAPVADRLWERLAPAMDSPMGDGRPSTLDDYFDVRLLSGDEPTEVAGVTVRCRMTKHPIPTIGLLVADHDATLGWSGDTAFDPAHIEWLRDADLIIHETNVGEAVHTPIAALNALPDELRGKMRLIHVTDDFDPSSSDIPVLGEGEALTVEAGATA